MNVPTPICDYDIYLHTKNPNQMFLFDFEYCTENVGALVNRARAFC